MEKSIFIKTVSIDDPRNTGDAIDLDIHQIEGGFIGISSDFVEQVANYIMNPYEGCQLVKLSSPDGNDDELDPPIEEDETIGFLMILKAFDDTCSLLPKESRETILDGIAKRSGLGRKNVDLLLGMAKETLDMAALARFTRVLQDDEPK
mgnify:CR=1 FL=1